MAKSQDTEIVREKQTTYGPKLNREIKKTLEDMKLNSKTYKTKKGDKEIKMNY